MNKQQDLEKFVDLCGYRILPEEVSHIEKHKYFMSLEARRDVGLEAAVSDWFMRIRKDFALWFNTQDISEQMIALNLHLARLKKCNIPYDESEEIRRFAENWRLEHPRIPASGFCKELFHEEEACCTIDFFSDKGISGTEIRKKVCLDAGVHIRPSVHLYSILHGRYDVRIFLNNRNVEKAAPFYPHHIYRFNNRFYFDVSRASIMEFLEVAAVPVGSTLRIMIESSNDSIVRDVCRDLTFLDGRRFCSGDGI